MFILLAPQTSGKGRRLNYFSWVQTRAGSTNLWKVKHVLAPQTSGKGSRLNYFSWVQTRAGSTNLWKGPPTELLFLGSNTCWLHKPLERAADWTTFLGYKHVLAPQTSGKGRRLNYFSWVQTHGFVYTLHMISWQLFLAQITGDMYQ
jgi:hypothetical protein